MAEVPIDLTEGQRASADDRPDAARQYVNWLVDNNQTIRQRPGIVNTDLDPGTYNRTTGTLTGIMGSYVWASAFDAREYLVYVRQDRTIWAKDLITSVVTALSTADITTQLDGAAAVATFAEDTQRLVIAGGGQLQIWTGAGLSSRISAYVFGVNQPPQSATHVLSIANYLVANNATTPGLRGQIAWSNLGDSNHTAWNPLNFNTADADADPIVALGANLRQVFAFGTKTVQTFGIGSDPYVPFTSASAIVLGCAAPYSPIAIDGGHFALLDSSRRFVTTDGNSSQWLSKDIDKLLRDLSTVSDCFGFRLRIAFWDLLVWVFPTAQRAYACDIGSAVASSMSSAGSSGRWYQIRGWNGVDDFAAIRIGAYAYWATQGMHIVGDPLFENLWTLNANANSDTGPGTPIVSDIVTERLDNGLSGRKRTERVRFFLRRGATPQGTTAPTLDLMKRDDDGPWTSNTQLDLGVAGDYTSFKDWFPGGIYRRRQYRVRYSGGQTTSIRQMVEYLEPYGG
jgi:hypothetical protein